MRKSQKYGQYLKVARAIFCLAFALLFLTETFIPLVQTDESDPMELSENAEEGEEKKEKEESKEVFDTDEFFARHELQQFSVVPRLTAAFDHLQFHSDSVTEIDTPPPEVA